ncbi:MAG: topoisomerase C-terminal repeat-containing protein, partial [Erythrobacter cryptus]
KRFWQDFKPRAEGVMDKLPSEVTEALDAYLSDYLFPPRADGGDPRACPLCAAEGRSGGRLALRGGRFGAFVACANYPACKYTRRFAQGDSAGAGEGAGEDGVLGVHPETGETIYRKSGRFGPYVQLGEGKEAKRASIPKDLEDFDLDWAVKLLGLPRIIGLHPDTGKQIEANIGRYGPYLRHDGKYGRLGSTREVFEIGMNRAVAILAEAGARTGAGGGRASPAPIADLGPHPQSGAAIRVMPGRYGPYVTDGTTNATLPREMKPEEVTLETALALIEARAAKAPAKATSKRAGKARGATAKASGTKAGGKKAAAGKTRRSKAPAPG